MGMQLPANPQRRRLAVRLAAALATGLLSACANVPAYQQERLSQPSMTFSDDVVDTQRATLVGQLEPASEASGGAQSSGCSACR